MALFDTLLAARGAIERWLVNNPRNPNDEDAKKTQRQKMVDAEDQLSKALRSIEDAELSDDLDNLEGDAQTLRDAATRIQNIEASFAKVTAIVADVGTIVGILQKVLTGLG